MRAEVAWHFSGEKRDYSIKGDGKIGCPFGKKMNLDPTLTPFSKINSRWIRELKCQKQTLKLSLEKYRWISFRPWGKEGFLTQAQKVQTIKGKICDFDFMKIKKSCSSETFLKKMRKQATHLEKIICNTYITGKGLVSRICKDSYKIPRKGQTAQ